MQVEDVTGVCLTTRRAAQQQGNRPVCLGLLRQVVKDDQSVLAVVHPVLANGRTGVGREVLEAGRFVGGRRHDGGVSQRAGLLQGVEDSPDRRLLLPDRHIHALDLELRIPRRPVLPLVDDRIQRDGALAGLPVADDQLTLTTADGGHRVHRLDTGLERLLDRLALDDRGRLQFQGTGLGGDDLAEPVDRAAQRIDHPAEEAVPDRDREDLAGAADLLAFLDVFGLAEDDAADLGDVKVQRQAQHAAMELQQLIGHDVRKTLDPRDAVAGDDDPADLLPLPDGCLVGVDVVPEGGADFLRSNGEFSHRFGPSINGEGTSRRSCEVWVSTRTLYRCSRRRASVRRRMTLPSTTSSPIRTTTPPRTEGSTSIWSWTSRPKYRLIAVRNRKIWSPARGTAVRTTATSRFRRAAAITVSCSRRRSRSPW